MPEKVFVVFGSVSDSLVYGEIVRELKLHKVPVKLRVLSAHRTPKELEKALKASKAQVFVTGAGLSNALSGVVASQSLKPVIGVPLQSAFGGIDSFLSTVQIPPGISVLCVGLGEAKSAAFHATNAVKGFENLVLVERRGAESKAAYEKACLKLQELGVKFFSSSEPNYANPKQLFLDFVPLEEFSSLGNANSSVIIVPLKKESNAHDAVFFAENAKHHLFVGVNRVENAVLGAIQLLGGKKNEKIIRDEREFQKKKVLDADKQENRKWNK